MHQAVCDATDSDGVGYCTLYARAGATLAELITGQPHHIQVGASYVRLSNRYPDGTADFHEMNPAATGYSGLELHAWFVQTLRGAPGQALRFGPTDTIADLSLRHMPTLARRLGLAWTRTDPLPESYWSYRGRLDRSGA